MLLCMDLGGTAVKLGLVDAQGHIHQRAEANVRSDGDATPILTAAMAAAKDFLTGTGVTVEGVGVSATGQVDSSTGVVIGTNGAIPHYEGVNIREAMEEAFELPVRVLNDANAAVLGECFTGAARGLRHVLMLTLGTGVGGGMVLDGRLYGGARGIAGELGHFPMERGGRPCTCGNRGCLEQYASTTALVRLACQATGEASLNGREIFACAARKDPTMLRVLAAWTADVAAGVTGLVHVFNPEMVLIGGGVSAQEALFLAPLRERVLAQVMPCFATGLRVERAALGNDAGLVGAAKWWMDSMENRAT